MPLLVMIDGDVVPPERACVSVFDRGFLYGDSVFETLRTYGGEPFELTAHMQRLEQSASRVLISLPTPLDTIRAEVLDAVRRAGNVEAYVRVMITRGRGEMDLAPDSASHSLRVIIVGPLRPPPEVSYQVGVGVVTYRTQRVADATDAVGAKVANYLVSVLALGRARQVGAVEALVVDGNDCIVEGATSNVFAVIQGRLVTPPEDAGILMGITRARVLDVARQLGMVPELRPLDLHEVSHAQEMFLSSSIRELLPVVRVDDMPVGTGRPGPVTQELLAAFRKRVSRDARS